MKENRTYNTGETDEDLRLRYNPDGSARRRAQLRLQLLDVVADGGLGHVQLRRGAGEISGIYHGEQRFEFGTEHKFFIPFLNHRLTNYNLLLSEK